MKSIAILKRTAFGDIIHALPVIPAIRARYPDTVITWITEQGYGPFVSAHEGVDSVVEIGFRSMLRSGRFELFRKRMRRFSLEKFDILLDLQGTLKSWMLLLFSHARRTVGFNRVDAREPLTARIYSEQAPPMPYGLHIVRQHLRLLTLLDIEDDVIRWPHLRISDDDESYIDEQLGGLAGETLLAVNPFTNWRTKSWPARRVAAFCRLARERAGVRPMLLWGPKEEDRAREIARAARGAAFLAPKTTLLQLAALLKRCVAYLGGDTGPTHLAEELGVPVVALFGPTDPRRNGPVDGRDEALWLGMECKGCSRSTCRLNDEDPECLVRITPEDALAALERRLAAKT